MANKTWKDMTFKLDNAAGSLTALTTFVNMASLATAMEILDDTALSETVRGKVAGLTDISIEVNGFLNTTTEGIFGAVVNGTSITKTFELYNGVKYYNGEAWPADVSFSGEAGQLQTFSTTLQVNGLVNRTSVALA
jgi:hypothetical protein